ncbi:uncharacterized protein PG986_009135 [Apiospora aurea]|uniref:Uncharacterized protein n=1 Tax=Apiospora aurea TaxID=335848 RepID=A0ABR1Q6V1_9PEZI
MQKSPEPTGQVRKHGNCKGDGDCFFVSPPPNSPSHSPARTRAMTRRDETRRDDEDDDDDDDDHELMVWSGLAGTARSVPFGLELVQAGDG